MSLQRSKQKETCPCCGDVRKLWTYRLESLRYCANCLHSIGWTTRGTVASDGLYKQAWRRIVGEPAHRARYE